MQPAAGQRITNQHGDAIQPFFETLSVAERLVQPASQLSGAHRGGRFPNDQASQVVAAREPVGSQPKAAASGWIEVHERLRMLRMQSQASGFQS